MENKIKIIIVDDLPIFREGLKSILEESEDIIVAGEACNGVEALQLVSDVKPDVVIADIQMPEMDGIEMTKELKAIYPEIPVIALTMYQDDYLVADMIEAGAKGYLLKSANKETFNEAIKAVHIGGWYYCDGTSIKITKILSGRKTALPPPAPGTFNDIELQVIQLICEQYSTKEIASKMHLGERTIEQYRHKIYEKMNVRNVAGVAIYALRRGIFKAAG